MMNQIGASTPSVNDDVVSALVMGGGDSVVAGYNKEEGVVNLLFSSESRFHCFAGMFVFIFLFSLEALFVCF